MAEDVLEALTVIGYNELDKDAFEKAIVGGSKSIPFTKLVEWITKELQFLYSLDEHVNAIVTPEDSSAFLMELSSFLKEIGCQYSVLMEGHINARLQTVSNKILLLNYLLTELKSARMIQSNKPDNTLQVTLNESSTAIDLKKMLMVMKFPKPPANIPPKILFGKVEVKLKELISKVPIALYGEPLFIGKLSDKQWHVMDVFYKELFAEYRMRREMLLKRLDVTIQSFEWSDRLKAKSNEIKKSFQLIRNTMIAEPCVKLSDILAARKDLAILEKTSSASVRRKTKSDVNKVLIGNVPDRGGRPYEQEPPPPEMPSWKQRSDTSGSGRGRGGGSRNNFGGGNAGKNYNDSIGGGRVQAGWNQSQNNSQNQYVSTGYDQNKGGGNYFKQGGYQMESNYGNNSGSRYHTSQGNNQSFDNRFSNRGGYNSGRGRGGGYQNYGGTDETNYQDYQNKNETSRNYYSRR